MKFSTKSTYGLRAIIKIAKHMDQGAISLATIANEEKISLGYLEKIISQLKKAGLVKASKGVSGGYSLARQPEEVSAYEIIKTLEGKNVFYCLDEGGKVYCNQSCHCEANSFLLKLQGKIISALSSVTLSDLIDNR